MPSRWVAGVVCGSKVAVVGDTETQGLEEENDLAVGDVGLEEEAGD